jgi:hypothetical protein
VQQPIESVKLVVKGLVLRDRAVAHGLKRGHGRLSGTEVGKPPCLNPPAAETAEPNVRAWLGKNSTTPPFCYRKQLS